MTTLRTAILLKRDSSDDTIVKELKPNEAAQYMEGVDFCNPHLLVKDEWKHNMRRQFFKEFFTHLKTYLVNTTLPAVETHRVIKEEILKM